MCGIAEEAQAGQWSRIICNQPIVARYVIVQVCSSTTVKENVLVNRKHISGFTNHGSFN